MISIFFFSLIAVYYLSLAGLILQHPNKSNYSLPIFGSIILSFFALLINFFIALEPTINNIIFFLIIFFGTFYLIVIKKLKKVILSSLLIATICTLILTLDTINRPDGSLYHLPYTKILNDNKIIFGIANIHFRFGHTSIIQYLNAIFFNIIFKENGILIPAAAIFSSFFLFCLNELKKNIVADKILFIYIYFIFAYLIYGYNRYSEFGNDVIAHLLFLITSIYFLKTKISISEKSNELSEILILAIFCFMLKPTLILVLALPLYHYLFNFKISLIFSKRNIFIIFFLLIWFLKNIITSGCLIYPIEITCFEKLSWFSNNLDYNIAPKLQSLDNEAWTKGWPDYKGGPILQQDYVRNLFWLKTWFWGHGILIIKKLSIFIIFIIFINLICKKIYNSSFEPNKISTEDKKKLLFLFLISICGCIVWFFRFPIFRYGSSYLVIFLAIGGTLIIKNKLQNESLLKIFKNLKLVLIIITLLFAMKHFLRIYKNYPINYTNYPWPKFSSIKQKDDPYKSKLMSLNNKEAYYLLQEGDGCGYRESPCTPYPVKNTEFTIKNKYKFYTLIK